MPFEIKQATRQGVRPIICLYSESGCGKTYSSLLLARGMVGPNGKIVQADSESGRGSLYADVIPGGYFSCPISEPFSPARYIELVRTIEQSDAKIGVIDSGSHEWEGVGGILDMASDNESKSGKPGLHCWKLPKLEHQKFMLKLLQSPIPWIICLRAKHKSRQGKDEKGKTIIIKDEFTTPIQADDFIFECMIHGELLSDHSFRLTKCSHPELKKCFPTNGPIEIKHGELLAQWCAAAGNPPTVPAPKKPKSRLDELKLQLWKMTEEEHKGDKKCLQQWLWDENLMSDTEALEEMTEKRLEEIILHTERKMNDFTP